MQSPHHENIQNTRILASVEPATVMQSYHKQHSHRKIVHYRAIMQSGLTLSYSIVVKPGSGEHSTTKRTTQTSCPAINEVAPARAQLTTDQGTINTLLLHPAIMPLCPPPLLDLVISFHPHQPTHARHNTARPSCTMFQARNVKPA